MPPVIGLDFGTTNSAIAVADAGQQATLASFDDRSNTTTSFRTILYFPPKDRSAQVQAETKAGPEAISSYLDADSKGRLILSIKSYLASRLFTATQINGRYFTLEDLIAIILRRLRVAVIEQFGVPATSVVLGRPFALLEPTPTRTRHWLSTDSNQRGSRRLFGSYFRAGTSSGRISI